MTGRQSYGQKKVRTKIFLASVLKPIDDPRMYEKIGLSLAKYYEVHLLGHRTHCLPCPIVHQHACYDFSAAKNKRYRAGIDFLREVNREKPDLLLVHTPELLWFALCYKWKTGTKLVYDVRENYWRNIVYQPNYKGIKKWFLALAVRFTEWVAYRFADAVFLAEKCYLGEMPLPKKKVLVLENKYKPLVAVARRLNIALKLPLRMVCTGTFSDTYGTLRAIAWVVSLRKAGYAVSLTLAGKAANETIKTKIVALSRQYDFITQIGGGDLLPHTEILNTLLRSDLALLPYKPNKSTENCIPTKLYECLALHIPMVIAKNPLWQQQCAPYPAAFFSTFLPQDAEADLQHILCKQFYRRPSGKSVLWEKNESKLLAKIAAILGKKGERLTV